MTSGAGRFLLAMGLVLGAAAGAAQATGPIFSFNSPPILHLSADKGSFTLTFKDFIQGSWSDAETVTYRVRANNMAAGTVRGAVSADLQDELEEITLAAEVGEFQNQGEAGFAGLAKAGSKALEIHSGQTALVDKTPGGGSFDLCVDGEIQVAWKGQLKADVPEGKQHQRLVVTVRDGR